MENKNKISNGLNILICTGIFPPDIGGPAYYAKNIEEEFLKEKHDVNVLTYGLEKKLPTGIRHCFYFLKVLFELPKIDLIIALDTFSAGLPAVLAAKIFDKKTIIRIGGDFLWESYVERSGNLIALKKFYEEKPVLIFKEKIIFSLTRLVLKDSSAIVFSTEWQKNIWQKVYNMNLQKLFVVENFYGKKIADLGFKQKNFLWGGRPIKLKNLQNLEEAFSEAREENHDIKLEIIGKLSRDDFIEKIRNCYAVILPSISDISPNFILEAIAANKPFIVTEETGIYDMLKNIGIFINPFDKNDIKKKILFLADNGNYQDYKKRIQSFVFNHSWRQIAGEFLEIYKKL